MTATNRLRRVGRVTVPLKVLALFVFVASLFLDWHRASVEVAGVVDVEETSSGWHGWGFVAGVFALLLLAVALGERRHGEPTTGHALAVGMLPLGLLVTTGLAVFTGDASVQVAGVVDVEVQTTLWPAWLALSLAVVTASAYLVELFTELRERGPHGLAPTAPA